MSSVMDANSRSALRTYIGPIEEARALFPKAFLEVRNEGPRGGPGDDERLYIQVGERRVTFKVKWKGKEISEKAMKKCLEDAKVLLSEVETS